MRRNRKIAHLWLFQLLADITSLAAAYYTTFFIRFYTAWGQRFFESIMPIFGARPAIAEPRMFEPFYIASAPRIMFFVSVTVFMLYALFNLYPGRKFIFKRPVGWNIVLCNLAALVLFYAYFYLRRNIFHPRSFFASLIFFNILYCIVLRGWMNRFLQWLRDRKGMDKCSTVVVGQSSEGDALCGYIDLLHPHGMWLRRRIARDGEPIDSVCEQLREEKAADNDIDMVILANKNLSVGEIMQFLQVTGELGVATKVLTDKLDVLIIQARMPVDMVQSVPLLHFAAPVSRLRERSKAVWSYLFATASVVVLAPLQAIIALLIKSSSPGPVFFIQERIGVNRKPFRMFKFRTMYDRAEESLAQLEEFNESGRGLFKIQKDPRVTPVGRLLRRFSLDELPQLYNVLLGNMTIVGPRPLPRSDFENYYEKWHYSRHSGMPGLTCLWQVSGRSHLDFHNMCILDVFYLRNQSWVLDIKIVLRTIWVVLFAKGAY